MYPHAEFKSIQNLVRSIKKKGHPCSFVVVSIYIPLVEQKNCTIEQPIDQIKHKDVGSCRNCIELISFPCEFKKTTLEQKFNRYKRV